MPYTSFAAPPRNSSGFAYRAGHVMTAKANVLTAACYAVAPKHSYITGGSSGGSELGWPLRSPSRTHVDYFRYVVHADPKWDWHAFDLSRDVALADQKGQDALNAVDPDLRRFAQRGGKLILFHGWEDSALAPR